MNINVQLGMRIAYLRKQKGWSQEVLSFESDINKNYLSDLERGRRNPSLKILNKVATAFGIDLETLFKGISPII
ncbi:MAG: helix-turn-helix transcriptional regulator [Bacilli bacterium]|jgi:transcriptional regulator with XRE-family HTH domain